MENNTIKYAGFWLRLMAWLIDLIILFFINSTLYEIFKLSALGILIIPFGGIIINWLYYSIMESSDQKATIGKLLLNIEVTDYKYKKISFGQATARYFLKLISIVFLGIGIIMIGFTKKKQGLHDIISKCLVIKEKKDEFNFVLNDLKEEEIAKKISGSIIKDTINIEENTIISLIKKEISYKEDWQNLYAIRRIKKRIYEIIKKKIKIKQKTEKKLNLKKYTTKIKRSRKKITIIIIAIPFLILLILFILHLGNNYNKTLVLIDPQQKIPFSNCEWEKLILEDLRIGLWVQVCNETSIVPKTEYYIKESSIIEKTTRNGKVYEKTIIQLFEKNPEQSIEEFITKNFKQGMTNYQFENCNIKLKTINNKSITNIARELVIKKSGIERYEIIPSEEMQNEAKKINGESIGSWAGLCGNYGLTNVSQYFQYNPNEDSSRVLFIFEGQDIPFFDPDTIKLWN